MNADDVAVTEACEAGRCDDCPAWMRPFQLARTPCDCECHTQSGSTEVTP